MSGSFIVEQTENSIQNQKNKHLSTFECEEIATLHKAGHFNQEIARCP